MRRAGQNGGASVTRTAALLGSFRHYPNLVVVLVVAAVVSSGLTACGDDSEDNSRDDDGVVESGTPEATGEDIGEDDADSYVHPTGCIHFAPDGEWEQVDETDLGVSYSADPENPYSDPSGLGLGPEPGEPGVLVTANCSPLDQVGAPGPVAVPGFDLVDDRTVDFGGGEGRLVEYHTERPGVPVHVDLQVAVDINDARCTLQLVGNLDSVDALRDDFDAALDSYRCAGR